MMKTVVGKTGCFFLMSGIAYGTLMLAPQTAEAGFSFVPAQDKSSMAPVQQVVSSPTAQQQQEPVTQDVQEPIAPASISQQALPPVTGRQILTEEESKMLAPRPISELLNPVDVMGEPPQQETIPAVENVASLADAPVLGEGGGAVVHGFGSDMPLVVALRQIVPSEYGFVFGDNVNMGMRVDWQGGQPWDTVLQNLASENGFSVHIKKRAVVIGSQMPKPMAQDPMPVTAKTIEIDEPPQAPQSLTSPEQAPLVTRDQSAPVPLDLPKMEDLTRKTAVAQQQPQQSVKSITAKSPSEKLFIKKRILVEESDGGMKEIESEPKAVAEYEMNTDATTDIMWQEEQIVQEEMPSMAQSPDQMIADIVSSAPVYSEPETQSTAQQPMPLTTQETEMPMATISDTSAPMPPPSQAFFVEEEEGVWSAEKGTTLRTVLQKWANSEGVSLVWSSEYDYPIQADMQIVGSFEDAVRSALEGFNRASPRPMGRLHTNKPTGAPVLVIESERLAN